MIFLSTTINTIIHAQKQSEKTDDSRSIIALELEMFRLSTYNRGDATITKVPEYFRRVPQESNPQLKTDPLLDKSPFGLKTDCGFGDYLNLKIWFFSSIAVGIGLRGNSYDDDTKKVSSYYLYPERPAPFYVGYGFTISEETEKRIFRYFIEVKTPSLVAFTIPNPQVNYNIKIFGGYEPRSTTFTIRAENGWHTWGTFKPMQKLTLAQIDVTSKYYYGLSLEAHDEDSKKVIGFVKLFMTNNDYKLRHWEDGEGFGISFKKKFFLFGGSLGIIKYF